MSWRQYLLAGLSGSILTSVGRDSDEPGQRMGEGQVIAAARVGLYEPQTPH